MSRLVLFVFFSVFCYNLIAQAPNTDAPVTREIGVRFSGFDDFNLFYKKAASENVFIRHRFLFGSVAFNSNRNDIDIAFGYAIGKEKRKSIADNLYFIHGLEYSFSFSHSNSELNQGSRIRNFFLTHRLGYVLGFQLDVSTKVAISAEVIPTLGGTFALMSNADNQFLFDLGINTNATALSVMYRF